MKKPPKGSDIIADKIFKDKVYYENMVKYGYVGMESIIYDVIIAPKRFWKKQKQEEISQPKLLTGYFLPLLLLVAVAIFAGELLRGSRFYIFFPLIKALRAIILFLSLYVVSVFFINELIKVCGGTKNVLIVRKLVVFSLTPFLLISFITGLFPFLYVLDFLGLYGFYIFWTGVKELLVFSEKRHISYTLIAFISIFFVFSFFSILLSKLLIVIL